MRRRIGAYARSQSGFTLVEVVITVAIGAILMTALTSVILTASRAATTATSRVEASGQIRNFQFFAHDDFAQANVPTPIGCGTPDNPCITATTITLNGAYPVSYTWDGSAILDRQAGSNVTHMATNVTGFTWYVDGSTPHPTVVVNLTVTVQSYSESQTFLFYPELNP
jgi:prepilin-type N-terminal cleavage/methylation domain-containing protein